MSEKTQPSALPELTSKLLKGMMTVVLDTVPNGPDAVVLLLVRVDGDSTTLPAVLTREGVEVTPRLLLQTAKELQQTALQLLAKTIQMNSQGVADARQEKGQGTPTE